VKPSLHGSGVRCTAAALLACLCAAGTAAAALGPPDVIIEQNVPVAMRDGTVLRADVYRPAAPGPYPVLVYRTPYGKDGAATAYTTHLAAVARGYAVVLQDVRGRYASAGEFDPYRHEGHDGYDTIEWAAAQPWSDGRVGTFGLSYPGAVQWLAAVERPPHLVAMVPAMTFSSPRNFFYMNGVFDLSWLPWIYDNIAPDRRRRLGLADDDGEREPWSEVADRYSSYRPLAELPWLHREAPFYFEWLAHPPRDAWWDWAELRGRYAAVDAAVLNLSGWFDEAYGPEGAVTNFNGLRAARDGAPRTHLVLGPWTHGVAATESTTAGDLAFGPQAAIDYDALLLDFFDHYLRAGSNRFASQPAVRYFRMGENRWHSADAWPPRDSRSQARYLELAMNGEHRLAPHAAAPGLSSSSTFVADPDDPVTDPYDSFGPHDYRALARRDDVLTFDSAPFTTDFAVAGNITALLHASCECRDFDLWVRIQDVYPDGRAMNIMSPGNDVLRASYREPGEPPRHAEPGQVYELRLADMHTAITFAAGHRLRVQISASFAPHFAGNLQTGRSEVDSATARPAAITIFHDRQHPSRLLLPVVD